VEKIDFFFASNVDVEVGLWVIWMLQWIAPCFFPHHFVDFTQDQCPMGFKEPKDFALIN